MNQLGAFESYDFAYVSRKSIQIEKHDFTKLPYTVDASGIVSYYNSNKVYNEQKSTFSSQYIQRLRITSGFVDDNTYTWLKELVSSPLIYLSINGYYVPVALADTEFEVKQRVNDNLTSLILNIEYGQTFNTQFR
jgi:hypothetical protein